jgi:hypothetical protein
VKTNIMKIFAIATLMIFIGSGVSMAGRWRENGGNRGHAYGHYKQGEYQHYQYYALPRPVYVERQYYPVVVERHVYHPPVAYRAPAPSGYFFGMSVMEPGMAFSFGVGGH